MSGGDGNPEGRLIGLLLPIGIVFVALTISNGMELGERVAQHKRLQTSLTAVRQQVIVGQAKGRRMAEVGRAVLDLAPTNQYAADIQRRFRIRPTGSRGEPAAVEPANEPEANRGAASPAPAVPAAVAPGSAGIPRAPSTAPANNPRPGIPSPATNGPVGSQFNLRPDGATLPATPQRPVGR